MISLEELRHETAPGEWAVPCPVCAGRAFSVLLEPGDVEAEHRFLAQFHARRIEGQVAEDAKDRATFTQHQPTYIVQCAACGTLLRDPQPTPRALAALYEHDTYGQDTLEQLAANQREFFAKKTRRLAPLLPKGARVLEIGAFTGAFLEAAQDCGWQATGVDIGEETVAFMRGRGLDVKRGDVCDLGERPLQRGAWDGVFIWNTFDQMPQPRRVLQCVHELLKPAGLLVLRVPNGTFEAACIERRRRAHDDKNPARANRILRAQAYNNFLTFPYLTGYTPASLRHLLAQCGFETQAVWGDTILRLADVHTLPFAAAEERRYKRAVRRLCDSIENATGEIYHPWMDVLSAECGVRNAE